MELLVSDTKEIVYTSRTHTVSGRDGSAHSDDGRLDIKLSRPGSGAAGTNPEQLFGAGSSACFLGAICRAALVRKISLPAQSSVDAEMDLAKSGDEFFLAARLNVKLPGIDAETTRQLADVAHQTCPYSKATRGNIDVNIRIVG
jgi:osmotically inducible protein OsmC